MLLFTRSTVPNYHNADKKLSSCQNLKRFFHHRTDSTVKRSFPETVNGIFTLPVKSYFSNSTLSVIFKLMSLIWIYAEWILKDKKEIPRLQARGATQMQWGKRDDDTFIYLRILKCGWSIRCEWGVAASMKEEEAETRLQNRLGQALKGWTPGSGSGWEIGSGFCHPCRKCPKGVGHIPPLLAPEFVNLCAILSLLPWEWNKNKQ